MARRYYVLIGGRKRYLPPGLVKSAADLRQAAQNAANNLGQAVVGGWDPPRRRRPSYSRNPVNPHLKAASVELLSFLRGKDITAGQVRAIRKIAAKGKPAPKRKALPKASKAAKRAPSRDAAAARRAGYSRDDNPYEAGTMGHRLWQRRFDDDGS